MASTCLRSPGCTLYWPGLRRLLLPDHVCGAPGVGFDHCGAGDHFGVVHMLNARNRRNKRAIRIGYALFFIAIAVVGKRCIADTPIGIELKATARDVAYWAHIACPLLAVWLYWLHRLVGPRVKCMSRGESAQPPRLLLLMVFVQMQDPRDWNVAGPKDGEKYFQPSLARTATGNFIPAKAMMNDEYCKKCHKDVYDSWFHSAHHFSSFKQSCIPGRDSGDAESRAGARWNRPSLALGALVVTILCRSLAGHLTNQTTTM